MNGHDAAGPSPFEARPALQVEHLRMTARDLTAPRDPVIASEATQSRVVSRRDSGLFRCARNADAASHCEPSS